MDDLYRRALELDRRVKQYTDNGHAGEAHDLWVQVKKLGEEIQMKKGFETLDNRAKLIMSQLDSLRSNNTFSPGDLDDLHDRTQEIRDQLRDVF